MLDWLDPKWLTIAQIIATLVIASVGAKIAIGNSVGFKPRVLVRFPGVSNTDIPAITNLHCTFDVWNRRKYPIIVQWAEVRFGDAKLIRHPVVFPGTWFAHSNEVAALIEERVIEPGKYERFEAKVEQSGRDTRIFEKNTFLGVKVGMIDPYRGRLITARGILGRSKRATLWRIGVPL